MLLLASDGAELSNSHTFRASVSTSKRTHKNVMLESSLSLTRTRRGLEFPPVIYNFVMDVLLKDKNHIKNGISGTMVDLVRKC